MFNQGWKAVAFKEVFTRYVNEWKDGLHNLEFYPSDPKPVCHEGRDSGPCLLVGECDCLTPAALLRCWGVTLPEGVQAFVVSVTYGDECEAVK